MADAKKEEKAEGQEAAPKKSKKMLFIILGVVVLLIGAGVPTFMLLSGGATEDEAANKEPVHLEPVLESWQLDPIIVNLSESTSFLKTTIVIEYDMNIINATSKSGEGGGHAYGGGAAGGAAKPAGPPGAVGARMTQIRDAIIGKLSSKTAAEVLSFAGKEQLKEELVEAINDAIGLDESPVVQVYFLEFIIQ